MLEGRSIYVTRAPIHWSAQHDRDAYDIMWRNHTSIYHSEILALADVIARGIEGIMGSFVGVHMRRGDFVELGLLQAGEDLNRVRNSIRKHLQPSEPFYLATNEHDPEVLSTFRAMGAVLWQDVLRERLVTEAIDKLPTLKHMLGFEDYIGLIEQMVCARARMFIGTKCSSFTGQILNLRLRLLGDRNFFSLPH